MSKNPTITELFNLDTGAAENSKNLLVKQQDVIFKLRTKIENRLQTDKPLYACGICGQYVGLRLLRNRDEGEHTPYFAHLHDSGDCPIKTGTQYDKDSIKRMKYNGQKESDAHLELKYYIAKQLQMDARFSNVNVEKVIRGSGWSKSWKKPDISALFNGRPVVFEIQLTTTFLDVIVSRERFYKNEGMSIFWVFKDLNPLNAKATEKDVFFNNKANALSVTQESRTLSSNLGKLAFTGHYMRYIYDEESDKALQHWAEMPVIFDDIKFDTETLKPYFIDFEEQIKEVKASREKQEKQKKLHAINQLEKIVLDENYSEVRRFDCTNLLIKTGITIKETIGIKTLKFVRALISVRDNKVYFENQDEKWAWVANYVYDHHLEHWIVFLYAVKKYKRTTQVFTTEKLQIKRDKFKQQWKDDQAFKYKQLTDYYELFSALLPEIKEELQEQQEALA